MARSSVDLNSPESSDFYITIAVSTVSLRVRFPPGEMNGFIVFCKFLCEDLVVFLA